MMHLCCIFKVFYLIAGLKIWTQHLLWLVHGDAVMLLEGNDKNIKFTHQFQKQTQPKLKKDRISGPHTCARGRARQHSAAVSLLLNSSTNPLALTRSRGHRKGRVAAAARTAGLMTARSPDYRWSPWRLYPANNTLIFMRIVRRPPTAHLLRRWLFPASLGENLGFPEEE